MIRLDVKVYCCEDISKIENYKQALNAKQLGTFIIKEQ